MKRPLFIGLLASLVLLPGIARAQYHSDRGAVLGGIGGALAGAAIGKNNGNTAAGALIGGAAGLLGGAVLGNAMDNKAAREQAYQSQLSAQAVAQHRAVSTSDVISMVHNGVGDDVIIAHIRENGVQRKIEVSDVISLTKQGVSERVITAMQHSPVGHATPVVAPAPVYRTSPTPVVIEEHHYVTPAPYWHRPHYHPPVHYHHYHAPRSRSSVHWGMSVHN